MKNAIKATLVAAAFGTAAAAQGEVASTSDSGFITRDEAVVEANPKETWLALISPADWWSSQHTWSADAANLRLTPQAGGCFCEKIPEVEEPDRFTLEGSVEHMRVIQAYPESALRLVGALGPLQSEPVMGVLTIALSEVDVPGEFGTKKGTRIVWEYNVGGSMRYEIPVISKAVDGVMSLQLAGLAEKLGKVEAPADAGSEGAEDALVADPDDAVLEDATVEPLEADDSSDEKTIEIEDILPESADPAVPSEKKGPTVDEAFDDFGDFSEDDEVVPDEGEPDKGPEG